jgi:hypothetical protein
VTALPTDPVPLPATVTGRLSVDDMARHVPLRFVVPKDTPALAFDFAFTPGHPGAGDIPHQLSISVIGPAGPRGTRHNHADQSVLVAERVASPGYLPGAIEPGIWTVEIDCHRILPPGGIDWQLSAAAVPAPEGTEPARPARFAPRGGRGGSPGWYRGDLHRHTDHSDAVWTPEAMVADACDRGYDFVALTDHNTVSALPWVRAAAGTDLLVLPGMELTGFSGHALVLGSDRMHDWRIRDGQTMATRAAEVQGAGDLFVIAHPMSAGHPFCTGCFWAHPDVMPGPARLVEIWNGPWGPGPKNPLALDLFHGWLNAGHRLVATAGSDDHGRYPPDKRPAHVQIHASELSPPAILAGLRAGNVVLTCGPSLSVLGITRAGTPIRPGDAARVPPELHLTSAGSTPGASLRVVAGRRGAAGVRVVWSAEAGGDCMSIVPAAALDGVDWAMVELRAPDGSPEAIANPVFVRDWSGQVGSA